MVILIQSFSCLLYISLSRCYAMPAVVEKNAISFIDCMLLIRDPGVKVVISLTFKLWGEVVLWLVYGDCMGLTSILAKCTSARELAAYIVNI